VRIVLIGTVAFTRRCLEEIVEAGAQVAAVLTLAPEQAVFNSDYVDLEPNARAHGIPVHRIRRTADTETIDLLQSLAPDVIFVFGWSQLLPPELLVLPPLGCIGTHPALLPHGRGRHPIVWTLVEGLERSGLTFFYLDEGADTGDILWQGAFDVTLEDDAATLYAKIEEEAARGIREFLPQLAAGSAPRTPQDDTQATVWRKRTDEDRRIDWNAPSLVTYNLVRALTHPYVGATTTAAGGGVELVVWRARLLEGPSAAAAPGTVLAERGGGVEVRTGDASLLLVEVDPSGALRPGDVLGLAV
jgi:methionyl-tRNA formyltransferase